MKKHQGFTILELMVVMTIVAILAAIAMPSYQEQMRKKDRAVAQQEMQKIATMLEEHRSKNFSYKNFTLEGGGNTISVPVDSSTKKYNIAVTDANAVPLSEGGANGFGWAIIAFRVDEAGQAQNYDLRMMSKGERCMTRNRGDLLKDGCGDKGEKW